MQSCLSRAGCTRSSTGSSSSGKGRRQITSWSRKGKGKRLSGREVCEILRAGSQEALIDSFRLPCADRDRRAGTGQERTGDVHDSWPPQAESYQQARHQAREGINPFTKEPMTIKAKPARKVVKA